jgi:hypothetical protein
LKGGAWAASTSRAYTPSNSNFQDDGQNITFTWLAFGHQKKFFGDTRTVVLAVSDYRIPDQILAAANRPDQMLPFANREKHFRPNSGKTYFYKYSWIENGYGIYSTYDGNRAAESSGSLGQAHRWGVTWNDGVNQKAICIGDDMTLSTFHLLARIITAHPAAFGGFD